MIRTTKLKGKELKERFKKLSKPLTENVVSMVEPTKHHNRMKPTTSTLKSLEDMDDDEELDLDELIDELESEMEDEIDLDEILEEMGYYDEEDEELDELHDVKISKGYKEGRKLVDKLRRDLFRKLSDDELEDFMGVLKMSFGLKQFKEILRKPQKYIFIYMRKPKKNYYIKKEKEQPSKWRQKEGSNCDDITFTNGEVEIDFDTWINLEYK